MNVTLLKVLLALVPTFFMLVGAILVFLREREVTSLLQLLGAANLVVVVLAHICEGLGLFPAMQWGEEQSAGHYVDLSSAILALTLFPTGYLLHALKNKVKSPAMRDPNGDPRT
jgi:hypothetical protein